MIKVYRIATLSFNLIASIFILIELRHFIIGSSTITNTEDLIILFFIIGALYFSILFNIETSKHFKKKSNKYEMIDADEIKRTLNRKGFSNLTLYGNLIIGFIIVFSMTLIFLSEPLNAFLDDYSRLLSIIVITVYGLIQIHFSIIVKRKLAKRDS